MDVGRIFVIILLHCFLNIVQLIHPTEGKFLEILKKAIVNEEDDKLWIEEVDAVKNAEPELPLSLKAEGPESTLDKGSESREITSLHVPRESDEDAIDDTKDSTPKLIEFDQNVPQLKFENKRVKETDDMIEVSMNDEAEHPDGPDFEEFESKDTTNNEAFTYQDPILISSTARLHPEVEIRGGNFEMGSDDPKHFITGEYPSKQIYVKPFKIDRYSVTNADFMAFVRYTNYVTDAEKAKESYIYSRTDNEIDKGVFKTDAKHNVTESTRFRKEAGANWFKPQGNGVRASDNPSDPVVHVSYRDAHTFCQWLGKRLPTEKEWEFAARGGSVGFRYPWGDDLEISRSNLRQKPISAGTRSDQHIGLTAVDTYPAQNSYGVYDMIGNVWEWTTTIYAAPRIRMNSEADDTIRYIVKGCSFIESHTGNIFEQARMSARKGHESNYTAENVGFRCVQSLQPLIQELQEDNWKLMEDHEDQDGVDEMYAAQGADYRGEDSEVYRRIGDDEIWWETHLNDEL